MKLKREPAARAGIVRRFASVALWSPVLLVLFTGCQAPMGVDSGSPRAVYKQIHGNVPSDARTSSSTRAVLHRFDQEERFTESPDATLELLHSKAVESGDRGVLYALAELNYLAGDRLRQSVKPWEPRDARDYYLASAVYAWFFLVSSPSNSLMGAFDDRSRLACDLYNYGLGLALTERRSTNAVVLLEDGVRRLPIGEMEVKFAQPGFPWPLTEFKDFVLADQFLVHGLSVRNRQSGLGVPLVAVAKPTGKVKLSRSSPATVFLRIQGGLADLTNHQCRASLELYSPFVQSTVRVKDRDVPLETDTTVPLAYNLNQSLVWKLGNLQFLSGVEQIPSDIYLTRPYHPGRVPVVLVHGTFSSPIWWMEMLNTLSADPVLREHCQFWYFIYNSGNPVPYSAVRLREALAAKLKELDPDDKDPALQQMVVIGHSQGGLLTKLTATDTGDKLWQVVSTNRLEDLNIPQERKALIRKYAFYEALPFVKRVVFICTPHRGSYQIGNILRNLSRKLVTLPSTLVNQSKDLFGSSTNVHFPKELRTIRTSLDSMSPKNPFMLKIADIPLAPGVKGHSIIAVKGDGDYHKGKDGVVSYRSAHVDYVESEFIVRSSHSCQDKPPTIEEVNRILREHIASLPDAVIHPTATPPSAPHP